MRRRSFLSTLAQAGAVAAGGTGLARLKAAESRPRLRVGQFGTGHAHADGKLAALRSSPDFELVGVVEPDERLRRLAAARKDYAGCSSWGVT